MSNMQNYLSALATLFENPQEDISETMWMKMQWCCMTFDLYHLQINLTQHRLIATILFNAILQIRT